MSSLLRKYKCPEVSTNSYPKILERHSTDSKLEEFYQRMTPYKSIESRQFLRQCFSSHQETDNLYLKCLRVYTKAKIIFLIMFNHTLACKCKNIKSNINKLNAGATKIKTSPD